MVDCQDIGRYGHLLPANKMIKGLFLTHQHSDHYSGLEYLRDNGYKIEYLIAPRTDARGRESPSTNGTNSTIRNYFEGEGQTHRFALV